MSLIPEIIVGLFYRPSYAFARLKESSVNPFSFFLQAGLPFIVAAAMGRAWLASRGWEQPREVLFSLFLIHLVSFSATFLLGAFLIKKLAPRFKSLSHGGLTLKMVVAAYLPFLAGVALNWIVPESSLVSFVGLTYTIFIFGKATGIILETPSAKIVGFTVVSFLILFGGNYVLNLLLELLILPQPII